MSNVLTKQIRERIERQGENTLYMVRDFADLNNDGLVPVACLVWQKKGCLSDCPKAFTFTLSETASAY